MEVVAVAKNHSLLQELRKHLPTKVLIALAVATVAVLANAVVFYETLQTRTQSAQALQQTQLILERLQALLSTIKDAETGQRGYLLTGEEDYLAPYELARAELPAHMTRLREFAADGLIRLEATEALDILTREKLRELAETIRMSGVEKRGNALMVVRSNRGKSLMDQIRATVDDVERDARADLADRQRQWVAAAQRSEWVVQIDTAILLLLVIAAGIAALRDHRRQQQQAWVRNGQMRFGEIVQGDQRLEDLGERVLAFLGEYMNAGAGAMYSKVSKDRFTRIAGYAHPDGDRIEANQNLLGQAARDNRIVHLKQVPADYLAVSSSLGKSNSQELLIAPAAVDGFVYGVVELGFLRKLEPSELELLQRLSESLGIALRAARDRSRLEELLEETQRQAEELQAQQEELRVNNEELEEQGRTLKLAQVQLEAQQTELEQTNSQLEEQMQTLETQRDELNASQALLTQKAAELERSNQFKSEFVANMSHELRTPLNSTLILSNLLAENKEGGLSEQQISYARTINAAGNDLLTLINDILDISKIEAGKLELNAERLDIPALVGSLSTSFAINAEVKKLRFTTQIDTDAPTTMVSDEFRLGQVLKNLLSNAIKFTSRGEVELRVSASDADTVQFIVRDTGIGIPLSQQDVIFEAFRQADGSTHRRFGGSGLGLSIARELAQLLGGDITVASVAGEGSTFTLSMPLNYVARAPLELAAPVAAEVSAEAQPTLLPQSAPAVVATPVIDDREHLQANLRTILIIEDDPRFATIMHDVAQELGFQSVIAQTAKEGFSTAVSLRPSAILLDMKLPDYSGLAVLDQLKHEAKTRHIPVHIISAADYSREALARGAVGYALKPVKHEQLVAALRRLEAKFSQTLKHVLVVEDDDRQRDSVRLLLASENVEITGAATATQALELLKAGTFDCMVMDLNLPDMSGFELLVRMAEQEASAFPPVIIYTGRSLSPEEERQLGRFSRSIIIKSARSPERLLDEVTLFIHQVESQLPPERQRMLLDVRNRDEALEGRCVLIVEDDERNIFALSSVLKARGVVVEVARNGREALDALREQGVGGSSKPLVDLVLMDIMMPEMDGLTAMREIRKNPSWRKLPIIALTAKAMRDDQDACLAAGANDYMAKPLDVERLLSLARVWMPK